MTTEEARKLIGKTGLFGLRGQPAMVETKIEKLSPNEQNVYTAGWGWRELRELELRELFDQEQEPATAGPSDGGQEEEGETGQ